MTYSLVYGSSPRFTSFGGPLKLDCMMSIDGQEEKKELESLEKELESVNLDLDGLNKEIEAAIQESSESLEESAIKEKNELIGKLVVKVTGAKRMQAELMQKIAQHSKEQKHAALECQDNMPAMECEKYSQGPNFLHNGMPIHNTPGYHDNGNSMYRSTSASKIAKPPKYKSGQDICIFLDRFEQYMILCGQSYGEALDLRLLNLIEDDKAYRKLKSITAGLENVRNLSVTGFVAAIRSVLYPDAESRTLRDTLYRVKQSTDETAEDFALRIEAEAAKAFSPLEPSLKNEACLSALCNGLRSVEIRRKLKESELKSFESATRLAIKHEHILESTQESEETESALQSGFNVLRVGDTHRSRDQISGAVPQQYAPGNHGNQAGNAVPQQYAPGNHGNRSASNQGRNYRQQNIICYNCRGSGHIARRCPSTQSAQYRPQQQDNAGNSRQSGPRCYSCGIIGHYANRCENRGRSSHGRPDSAGARDSNNSADLNENAAGLYPVHPSRQN